MVTHEPLTQALGAHGIVNKHLFQASVKLNLTEYLNTPNIYTLKTEYKTLTRIQFARHDCRIRN
jgi:hypothetical protein